MTTKHIGIDQLRPGMFVVKTDMAWYASPFILLRRVINGPQDVDRLRRAGVKDIVIDVNRGLDIYDPVAHRRRERMRIPEAELVRDVRTDVMTVIRDAYKQAADDKPIDLAPMQGALDEALFWMDKRMDAYLQQIHLRRKVPAVIAHAYAVFILVAGFVRQLGLDETQQRILMQAALFHDIGWAKVPATLYGKREPYADSERALVYKHPQLGAAILMRTSGILGGVADITMQHHEKSNGSGYPFGLKSSALHKSTPLLALLASYDERVHGLSDAPPKSPACVLRDIANEAANGEWPVDLVEDFIQFVGKYPHGSAVRLNTGESGIVIAQNREQPLNPVVKLFYDERYRPLGAPLVFDLAKQIDQPKRYIQDIVDPGRADMDPDRLLIMSEA